MKKLLTLSLAALAVVSASASVYAQNEENKKEKELQTIYITAPSKFRESSKTAATSVTVLTEEEIEASGHISIPELLRTTTAIGVSDNGGVGTVTALRIRGEESYRTSVYLDGVKMVDPSGIQVTPRIEHLKVNGVERIEVLRGVQGFAYGADAGGVVNITTKRGAGKLKSNYIQSRGSNNHVDTALDLNAGNENIDFYISASNYRTEGINARLDDSSKDKDGYENTTVHTKLGFNVNDNLRLQAVVNRVLADSEYDKCGFPRSDDCVTEFTMHNNNFSADFDTINWKHRLSITKSEIDRDYFVDQEFSFMSAGEIDKVEYNGLFQSENYSIIFGADAEEQASSGTFVVPEQKYSNVGQFVEYKDTHITNLFLNIGVRYDRSSDYGEHLSPRIGIAYIIPQGKNKFKLRGLSGRGFRAASMYERSNNGGTKPFTEEQTKGSEIGLDWSKANGASLGITYFDQVISDEIVYQDAPTFKYLQEKGDSTSKGVEVFSTIPLAYEWSITTNYTYNEAKDRNKKQRVRRPVHLANVGIKYADEKLNSSLNFRASKKSIDLGGVELDNYLVADYGFTYTFQKGVSFYGSINNLFDKKYTEVVGYNTAERTFNFGTKVSF